MVKVSKMFLLAGSLCLVSPVMACDDDSDGNNPAAYMTQAPSQEKSQRSARFSEILEFSKELAGMDDGEYDDGDYASEPVAFTPTAPVKQKKKQAKVAKQAKPDVASKKVDKKAKNYALKASFNKRSTVDPFE